MDRYPDPRRVRDNTRRFGYSRPLLAFFGGVGGMADIPKMRERARYLREQAKWLRETGSKSSVNDSKLRERFFELAAECETIADKIDRNIDDGIHKP